MVPWMRIPVPLRGCAQEESGEDVMGQVMNSAKVAAWSWMAYLVDALEPRDLMTMARSAVVLPLCGRLTTLLVSGNWEHVWRCQHGGAGRCHGAWGRCHLSARKPGQIGTSGQRVEG